MWVLLLLLLGSFSVAVKATFSCQEQLVVKVTILPGSLIMFLHLFSRHVYFASSIFSSVCCWAAVPPPACLHMQQQPPVLQLLAVQQPDSCFDAASVFFLSAF